MTPALADRPHPMRSLLILSVAALAFALAQTTLIPALGELAGELHTDASGVAWTLTAYLLSAAVCTPIFGRLGDMFGKRRLLVISLGVFAAGSVVAALAHTLGLLVAGRVLQGAGGGIFPLCFAIIRDEFPREKVSSSIGLISATFGIGGGAGLIIGGVLVDGASYHWIFWLGAAMAVVAAVLTQLLIPESPNRQPGRIDVRGAAVLAVGLALPLLAIARANDWGWGSARTLGMIAAGVVILAGWVALERRTEQPLADVELLARPPVLMTNIATLLVGFGMFGSFILIPQLAEAPDSTGYGFGLDATGAGLLMLPGALVMLVAGPLAGRLVRRFGGKVPLALGAFISAVGLLLMAVDHGTPGRDGRLEHRALDRHRARVRRDAEPDLRRRAAVGDRRGDRLQHAGALRRRVAGLADLGRDPHRERRRGRRASLRRRLHDRVPRLRRRRDRGRARGARDPARGASGARARPASPRAAFAER